MTGLAEFFAQRAEAFRLGHLKDVAAAIVAPMPIFKGNDVQVIQRPGEMVSSLGACRSDLLREGYAWSDFVILAADCAASGRARVRVRWLNRSRRGGVINTSEMEYFLIRSQKEGWRIAMIDVLVPDRSRLAAV